MSWLSDAAAVLGVGIVATGLWWVYPPLGMLSVGAALIGVAWMLADKAKRG